ncbi:MAG: hypothetical protein QM687_04010 [Ferruginibacter sp.]
MKRKFFLQQAGIAAAWSAIELNNETVEFPDFTGGRWMYRKPVFALNDEF